MRPYPPLATLLTASVLREAGKEVALFDAMLSPGEEEFAALVSSTRPAIVGMLEDNFNFLTKMCTTRRREASLRMIRDAKASGARVAVNGSDAADAPELYLSAGADAVLLGETERTFLELVERWEVDPLADLSDVPGLALPARAVGAFAPAVRTAPRPFVQDLDALPLPAWDLVDEEQYRAAWTEAHGRLSWNVVTTRGCPYRCNWCAKPLYGTRYAQRSPRNVAAEMARLKATGPARPRLVRRRHLRPLAPLDRALRRRARASATPSIPFTIQSRVDLMTPSSVAALARAGRRGGLDGRRVGRPEDPRRDGQGDDDRPGARGDAPPEGARHPRVVVPPARLPRRGVGRDPRDARPRPRGAARRRRRLGRLPAPRHRSSTSA